MGSPKEGNWAYIHRKLAKSDLWLAEEFTRGQAWVDLIMLASYRPSHVRIRGVRIEVQRGQYVTALRYLAERWRWSKGKVERFLRELETDKQIGTQKNNVSTVITITNYNEYQGNGYADRDTDGTQTGQQTGQSKEILNQLKEVEGSRERGARPPAPKFQPPTVEQVAAYCKERSNSVNPQRFVDYYEARGWKLKTGTMKNWKAAVRTWETNDTNSRGSPLFDNADPRGVSAAMDAYLNS